MSFTLKDIPGAVVEKIEESGTMPRVFRTRGFNQGIDQQSSIPLRFNREKLIKIIEKIYIGSLNEIRQVADAIIAAEKKIVEMSLKDADKEDGK